MARTARRRWAGNRLWSIVLLGGLVMAGCQSKDTEPKPTPDKPLRSKQTLQSAERKLKIGLYDEAAEIVYRILLENESDPSAMLLAGKIEQARGDSRRAAQLASDVGFDDDRFGVAAATLCAEAARSMGDTTREISALKSLTETQPSQPSFRRRLRSLLREQGRYEESAGHALRLAALGIATLPELASLVDRNTVFPYPPKDSRASEVPDGTPLAMARWLFAAGHAAEAEDVLSDESTRAPAAAAFYLRILAEQQKTDLFRDAIQNCPAGVRQWSDYWSALGLVFIEQFQHEAAVGCLLRAVQRNPTSVVANQRLSQSLDALGRREDGDQFRYRGVALNQSAAKIRRIFAGGDSPAIRQALAEQLFEIERPIEALQWRKLALPPQSSALLARISEQQRMLAGNPEAKLIAAESARMHLHESEFPFEDALDHFVDSDKAVVDDATVLPAKVNAVPRLQNVAGDRGAAFQFYLGPEIKLHPIPLYASLGGGIAVIDYDLDGWPDVYFGQAGCEPSEVPSPRTNELRRNVGGQFVDFTESSQAVDRNYSTGIAVGDANQDGFPDLYLGTLGRNRLLINRGDGTFFDHTNEIMVDMDLFSASVAIADLDGDGLPELIEVNYLDRQGAMAPMKRSADGRWEQQMPLLNYGAPDRVCFSGGDGRFQGVLIGEDVVEPGTGLGLVVTDFDGRDGNEMFVGNDARANHFLRFDPKQKIFVNQADAIGNALGFSGVANACMGIATGDFDRNQTFDMHITNYVDEPVNLYVQSDAGTFRDVATRYGLNDASMPMVGFGTKAFDFDRNGWLDLLVANGHVFDRRQTGEAFRMPPQLFLSTGNSFVSATVDDETGYFSDRFLGRSIAMLDFDRDFETDFLVGHLDRPTALLRNETRPSGAVVRFELIGTISERDAIGARVSVDTGHGNYTQWVTAGDGYFCSDEAMVEIAIPEGDRVKSVTVVWPSGARENYLETDLGERYLLIEGSADAFSRRPVR